MSCRTPTFCALCEDGYSFDANTKACVYNIASQALKVTGIVVGSIAVAGVLYGAVYIGLNKLEVINKKIDPRKIRDFVKM